jgi:Uncharacterized protein conserved in bacteria
MTNSMSVLQHGEMKMNYQNELEKILPDIDENNNRLFLHSCCAPCSSYVLEYLAEYFAITIFYYNPNVYPESEYATRIEEQEMLLSKIKGKYPILFVKGHYDRQEFFEIAKGLEHEAEGGERCFRCYELRLRESAKRAKAGGFDYFTTTLSISPMKNAKKLNELGMKIGEEYQIVHLPSDFKKKGGYQRSVVLSNLYGLYRQDYCGCEFSIR